MSKVGPALPIDGLMVGGLTDRNLETGSGAATGAGDAFAAKYSLDGLTRIFVKQHGVPSQVIYGYDATADSAGNIFITGITSTNIETLSGSATGMFDGYVMKLNSSGILD